jgi:hypothetical protein
LLSRPPFEVATLRQAGQYYERLEIFSFYTCQVRLGESLSDLAAVRRDFLMLTKKGFDLIRATLIFLLFLQIVHVFHLMYLH